MFLDKFFSETNNSDPVKKAEVPDSMYLLSTGIHRKIQSQNPLHSSVLSVSGKFFSETNNSDPIKKATVSDSMYQLSTGIYRKIQSRNPLRSSVLCVSGQFFFLKLIIRTQ